MDNTFEIKISGEKVNPEDFNIGELAELLNSVEDSMKPLVLKENSGITPEEIIIGLIDIKTGSTKLKFKVNLALIMLSWNLLTSVIKKNNFSELPIKSIESLKKIATFSKNKGYSIEFHNMNETIASATISPDTIIEIPANKYLEGSTTLYGKVERVGGKKPKVALSLPNTNLLYCDTSEEMAIKLAHRLYTWVGVMGQAKWNIDDYSIETFQIESLTSFEDTPLSDAIKELSKITGDLWKEEKDVIKAVEQLRGKI